ncbi:hypothetical protein JCM16358_14550 [Halanaerocella petrolearia]
MVEKVTEVKEKMEKVVRKYRNIPYKHNGRSLRGLDCLGLVIFVYQEFGIDVPTGDGSSIPEDWYKKDPDRYLRGLLQIGRSVPFEDLQVLDLVYFKLLDDIVTHSGVMINDHEFIHILQDRNVEVGTLERRFWRRKIAGGRRIVELDK